MKKPTRRSKQKSGSDSSSSPSIISGDKENHDKRINDLELENEALKREIEELRSKMDDVTPNSCVGVQKLNQGYPQNSKTCAGKVVELKKLGIQSQLSAKKPGSDKMSEQFQDEIQRLKVQKVQLQCKMKLESMQFRLCKTSLEKEILQLKKEQRRNNYEKHVLSTLNQRQKHVLQRKTEEAFVAAKRLKDLIESKKASCGKIADARNGSKFGTKGIEQDFEVKMKLDEVCAKYEHRIEKMVDEIKKLKLEVEILREEKSRSQDKEAAINDSELIDLREEVAKLSCMVSQMNMSKAQLIQAERSQVDSVRTSVSVGSNIHASDMDTFEAEHSEGIIAMIERPSGVCCSCSKKSLCKTLKCECRATGSNCGMSCGCAMAKCTNREKVPFKLDDMPQPKMVQDIMPGNIEEEKGTIQDAILLQNKVVENLFEMNEDWGPRKQPLREIGNTMNTITGKPGPRKKGQKAAIQPLSLLENTKCPRRTNKNSG
ncbi:kinesin-like protein KIN-4C isoform X2 [Durio zibethinus]|uniref:Kinesin-like protein KIN-4C isoform X2 n=1 Tax=Durio zibethinus TaxID=66656 RepID=A0A6P5ZJ08_DURZI|nr:kinesin-like protein KIN-4C isoform X2 [Durio zibethinus]